MKKKIGIICIIILIILIGLAIMVIKEKDKNIEINIEDLASKIVETNAFEDKLEKVDSEMIMENYNFSYDEIEKLVSYQGSGASSEEIVILQVKDKSKLDSVKEKINTRLQERKEAFESYLPKEVGKIENNILIVKGNYVILCISNDNKQVNNILKDSNLW